jgi:Fe-S-cluster containining protein
MKGLCCRRFPLQLGPEELYQRIKSGRATDGFVLLEILRYIGLRPWTFARYTSAGAREHARIRATDGTLLHFYTCVRFDQKTGKCREYDLRPYMCHVYNRGDCEHVDCESFDCSEHPQNIKTTPAPVIVKKAPHSVLYEVKENEDCRFDLAISR